jgi:[acyl-carrier-protein] S-malonyltransferase
MGRSFHDHFPQARAVFTLANTLLGFDLEHLCFEGPDEALRETENAQVALFVTSVAAWNCFSAIYEAPPDAVAGHSVGEYAALVAAGSLDFADGVRLVRRRGELMREAAQRTPGAMAAVLGLETELVRESCQEAKAAGAGIVTLANINGAGQNVISGTVEAVAKASEIAKAKGARRVMPLAVSGAFHSPLMVAAGDALFHDLSHTAFRKPTLPVVSNVTAQYVEQPGDVTAGLTLQVSGSVRWEESMQLLLNDGFDTFIELGSGDKLGGLMKRIDRNARVISAHDADTLQTACELLKA